MKPKKHCVHCRRLFIANPRIKNQKYCNRDICQRARKSLWQRHKMATDADYRQNQKDSQKLWQTQHPDYWRQYRNHHPQYCERNRMLQKQRDIKRRAQHLAKMDTLKRLKPINPYTYYLIPCTASLAKMDALTQKINVIGQGYTNFCASCKKGLDGHHNSPRVDCTQKEVCHDH